MITVIDTNHLLRLAATMDRSPLFAAWRAGRFDLAVTTETLAELDEVARRPKTQRFLPPQHFAVFRALVETWAILVAPAAEFPHCRDPKDDHILAAAVAA